MSIMKKNLLFVCIALLTAITTKAGVPEDIGAIMGKNVPLYPQHNAEKPDLDSPKSITLDYKLVTLDGISYVYMRTSDDLVPGDGWGMQYRYWSETMGKTENNLLSKFGTYATQVVTEPMPDPLKYITFFVSTDGFSETDFITYDPKKFNSIDESDKIAPSITNVDINPSIFTAALNITGDDEDAFYYIEDAANNYKTVAIVKDVILTGLTASTTYNLTITPIDFNGNKGITNTKSFTTKADIEEVIVPATTATFNCAEAGSPLFEEVEDSDMGTVVHVKATDGAPYAMVQANQPLPEGLGDTGKEFSYAHVIVKCPKVGQVIRGSFNGEVAMMNSFIPENEWQDVMFDLGKTKIKDIVIFLDYYGGGQGGTFPKELWLKEVIFNNSATPIIEWAKDDEDPILNSVSLIDNSITYSSVQINVSATDNIGVVSYLIKDDANNFSKEFKVIDDVVTIEGLTPGTTYNFSVQAKDAAGNLSNAISLNNVTTVVRESECSGEIGHFAPADAEKMIYYEITYRSGSVTYRIEPNSSNSNYADKKINWAQIHRNVDGVYSGFDGMTISEDGKSATYTLNDVIPGTIIYNMFVFGFEGSDAHYQNAENNKLDGYVFYIAGDCAGALENVGTATDPILSGKWDADLFAGYGLNYANLTTLDLTEVSEINELPAMENLNPNCLIYVDKSSKISDTSKNIVVFDKGEGSAEAVTLQDGHPFNNTKEFTATSISYTRDFSGMNGWASLYLPFAVNVEGYTIETLTDYSSQEDKGYFYFESVTGTTPNTPYIMAVNGETNGVFNGSGTTPVATAANDVSIDNGTYVFKGTFNEIGTGSANGLYLLRTDGSEFAVGSDDSSVPAFRAYITSNSAFAADRINVLHDGEVPPPPTKINAQNASTLLVWSANGVLEIVADKAQCVKICSIDGCIVRNMELNEGHNVITNLPKGIYIVNNQKVIIK